MEQDRIKTPEKCPEFDLSWIVYTVMADELQISLPIYMRYSDALPEEIGH